MNGRNNCFPNSHARVREIIGDLLQMWQKAGFTRIGSFAKIGKSLGIKPRVTRGVYYQEPRFTLNEWDALFAERREPIGWLDLADEFLELAKQCETRAELARIKKSQGVLSLEGRQKWAGQSSLRRAA